MIKDYYGYRVTDTGTVYGKKGKEIKKHNRDGQWIVNLYIEGCPYTIKVKQLVATLYVDKPSGCDWVTCIDGNNNNLSAGNLKWTNEKDFNKSKSRMCNKYLNGKLVSSYSSASEAAKDNGVNPMTVWRWCNGICKDRRGYVWTWIE